MFVSWAKGGLRLAHTHTFSDPPKEKGANDLFSLSGANETSPFPLLALIPSLSFPACAQKRVDA